MKGLYKSHINAGHYTLHGIFVAEIGLIEDLIESKKHVYFGDVLGKHSNVGGSIEPSDVSLVTTDQDFIAKFEALNLSTGINPLEYDIE